MFGSKFKDIMNDTIKNLFDEAKKCYSINAYSASILCCRTLIINYANSKGAQDSVSFISGIDYLVENNYMPENRGDLIKNIKVREYPTKKEFKMSNKEEAEEIISFIDILLKFNSEFEVQSKTNNWLFLYRALKSHREDLKKIIECKTFDSFKNLFEELLKKSGIWSLGLKNLTFYPYSISGDKYSKYPDKVSQYLVYLTDAGSENQISDLGNLINDIVDEIDQDDLPAYLSLKDLSTQSYTTETSNKKNIRLADLLGPVSSKSKGFVNKYAVVSSKEINLGSNSRLQKIVDDYEIELISIPKFYSIEGL